MDRRMRTNLVLAAVVAALGLFLWLGPEPETEKPGVPLIGSDETVERLAVLENGEQRFALERTGDAWRLVAPFELPADDFQVEAFVDALGAETVRDYSIDEADLAELGLAEPRWTVDVNGTELRVGNRAALGNNRYVQKGNRVYLVSDVLSYRLQRDALDYASRKPLPEDVAIAAIELPNGRRVEKADAGWALLPEDESVSADALQGLVDAWRNARAMNLTQADSVPRDGEVLIEFVDGGELRFGVEMTDSGLKLTRDEPAVTYAFPRSAADDMLQLVAKNETGEDEAPGVAEPDNADNDTE